MKKKLEVIKKTAQELLEKMGVEAEVKVQEDKESEAIQVQLNSEDNALLVGYHGNNLSAFQLILGIITANKLGEWNRLIVDIDGYRQKRQAQLEEMARRALERVGISNQPVTITGLTSWERRTIHLFLKDEKGVETYSEGEGRNRQLVISPNA